MNVTFLIPPPLKNQRPVERVFGCSFELYPIPNIYLLTAAAVLEKNGFGAGYKDFSKDDQSDAYCIYSVFLSQAGDLQALDDIRRSRKNIPVIFLGPAPTFDPEKFLRDENVYVLRGEFDFTLSLLIQKIKEKDFSNIPGLSYICGARVVHQASQGPIEDLDSLPFPLRRLLDKDKFFSPKFGMKPYTAMLTSRGCPHRCIYCVPNSLSLARELEYKKKFPQKPPVRERSAENVIGEFQQIKEQGVGAVSVIDDQFVLSEERTISICEGIRGLKIDWGCASRADHLTDVVVRKMAEAGCRYVDIGIESFYQDELDYMKKDLTVEAIICAVKLLQKHGVLVKANILLGSSPLQTKERIRHSQALVKKLGIGQVMYNICAPYPGTAFYQMAKKNKWFVGGEYRPCDVQKEAIIAYPSLSKAELEGLAREGNRGFFLSWRYIFSRIFKIRSLREAVLYLKVGLKKLGR